MDNTFIILTATFVILMVLWLLFSVFFSLSENETRKRKKKKTKEVVKTETKVKEYIVKDMRNKKVETVGIVENANSLDEEEPQEYGNYMYDVLVSRNQEEEKIYRTEKKLEEFDKNSVNNSMPELKEGTPSYANISESQRYYGKVKDVDYVKVTNKIHQMENLQNDKNQSLATEFKNLSKEMKIYIIDNIIGNI